MQSNKDVSPRTFPDWLERKLREKAKPSTPQKIVMSESRYIKSRKERTNFSATRLLFSALTLT